MNGQALAGDFAGCLCNLETIARHYVREFVTVRFQPAQTWLGMARRTSNGREILINPGAALADLPYIFFHEVGHHVRGHIVIEDARRAADLVDDDQAARLGRLTPSEASVWTDEIDRRETEADAWANDTLAAFEAQHGPFLAAIGAAGSGVVQDVG